METRRSLPTLVVTVLALVFLYAPLVVVVLFSFHSSNSLSLPFQGFSLRWYREVLDDPSVRSGLFTSLRIASMTAVLTSVLGTTAAYGLSRLPSKIRTAVGAVFVAPVALPALILGVSLLSFFVLANVKLSTSTVVIAHTVYVMPIFFVVASTAFSRIEEAQLEAASDLGAGPWYRFWHVIFLQVLPVLLAGAAMAFVISFDEFIITVFVIGNESTLPVVIFSRLRRTIDPSVNAISTLLIVTNLVLWVGAYIWGTRLSRRRRRADEEAS